MDDIITINKFELQQLIAQEIAKAAIKPSEGLFYDVQIIKDGIKNANAKHQELVEFDKSANYGVGVYHQPLLALFKRRNRNGIDFDYINPTSGADPDTLIRKLVLQMFGCKYNKDIELEDIARAKEIYSRLSEIFLEIYEEHLDKIFDDKL